MKWKIEQNTISQLWVKDQNLIFPWGIETADSSAFFSLEDGIGYRYTVLEKNVFHTEKTFQETLVVKMREGLWELVIEDNILSSNILRRKATLTCLEESCFMDFVMRFRFRKDLFPIAKIADKHFSHQNENTYHQFPVLESTLSGDHQKAKIQVIDYKTPSPLSPWMYVRDQEEEWIVHARMLPKHWNKEVIKLCHTWTGTRPLPQWVSIPILAIPKVKQALWYRPERAPFTNPFFKRINPSAIPIVRLPKGEQLMWDIKVVML